MSSYKALISVFSKDRVGLISEVTSLLFDEGINLEDTSFAVLGSGGGLTSVVDVPSHLSPDILAADIRSLEGMGDADVDVKRFSLPDEETPPTEITHRILCEGEDQPGLLARLSEVFLDYGANIVRLKSDHVDTDKGTHFVTRFAVSIPQNKADACLATLGNTAEGLGQKLTFAVN